MKNIQLFGVQIFPQSKDNILEKIKKYIEEPRGFMQIVSLNPENIIEAQKNEEFKKIIETAQIQIVDGIGVQWAVRQLYGDSIERITGVEFMENLLQLARDMRLRVMLIGGKSKVAQRIAECYSQPQTEAKFFGIEGIHDIVHPTSEEEKKLFSIVADFRPHLLFVSFGSPAQELWIDRHKKELKGIVCMGVGGAFDFIAGTVPRAPSIMRSIGLEWLFRLMIQPWRWKRQLRLFVFVFKVLKGGHLSL